MADLRPADDHSILGDERLYIRIYPAHDALVEVANEGYRPTTGGVRRFPDEPLSVDLGSLSTPEQTRDRGTDGNFHVAMITAAVVRQLGFRIQRDPVVEGPAPNLAHALIHGTRPRPNGDLVGGLTGGEFSRIARAARIVLLVGGGQQPV